jgi:hypothetical protein
VCSHKDPNDKEPCKMKVFSEDTKCIENNENLDTFKYIQIKIIWENSTMNKGKIQAIDWRIYFLCI